MLTLDELAKLSQIVASGVTIVGAVIATLWAYGKFRKYEQRWLATQAQPALVVKVSGRVLPAPAPEECFLALTSTVTNRGKVNTLVDIDKSWFLVEQASDIVADEGSFVDGLDGKRYLVHDSLVDVATTRLRVKMNSIGPAVVRAGASVSQASVCQVFRGIYRITAQYALAAKDLKYFDDLTHGYQAPPDSNVVWSASIIVDSRRTAA